VAVRGADATVDRIDPETRTVRQTIKVGKGPDEVAFGAGSVWVTNGLDGTDIVRADGMTDSEAVRTALREAAARRRVRSAIREEVRRVPADKEDREEMRVIREQMAELAPPSGRQ
jgi:hypothetical protein